MFLFSHKVEKRIFFTSGYASDSFSFLRAIGWLFERELRKHHPTNFNESHSVTRTGYILIYARPRDHLLANDNRICSKGNRCISQIKTKAGK